MALTTTEITVDLLPKPNSVKVKASQYDNNTRLVLCNVQYDGEDFDLSEVSEVRVEGTRTDGVAFASVCTVSGSQCAFYITKEMTGCAGKHKAEIVLVGSDEERIGSMNFVIQVEAAPMDEDASVPPEDETVMQQYINTIQTTVDEATAGAVQEAQQYAEQAGEYAEDARGYSENVDGGSFNWG